MKVQPQQDAKSTIQSTMKSLKYTQTSEDVRSYFDVSMCLYAVLTAKKVKINAFLSLSWIGSSTLRLGEV